VPYLCINEEIHVIVQISHVHVYLIPDELLKLRDFDLVCGPYQLGVEHLVFNVARSVGFLLYEEFSVSYHECIFIYNSHILRLS